MDFRVLKGKTLTTVEGLTKDSEYVRFVTKEGDIYEMCHVQSCCEKVSVYDVCGDVEDIIGTPIEEARESSSEENPVDVGNEMRGESQTWTFYTLRTIKGSVDIRWHGESNGYYSERVDFELVGDKYGTK